MIISKKAFEKVKQKLIDKDLEYVVEIIEIYDRNLIISFIAIGIMIMIYFWLFMILFWS